MSKHGLGCLLGIIAGLSMACTAHAGIWYVDRDAAAGGDGTTWAKAFQTIQPGIDAAFADGGGEVWVAEGVYDEARDPTTGALLLKGSVDIYGGFSGDEANRDARDFALHPVVIDGSTSLGGSEAQTVVSIFGGEAFPVRMDGFTVRDGENGVALGGFYSLILANCRIEGNGTTEGLFINNASTLSLMGTIIQDCGGPAAIIEYVDIVDISDLLLTGNNNSASGEFNAPAGLVLCAIDELRMSRCMFDRNTTYGYGGALYLGNTWEFECPIVNGIIDDCVFTENKAGYGGAIYCGPAFYPERYSQCTFSNCLFYGNRASHHAVMYAARLLETARKASDLSITEAGDTVPGKSPEGEGSTDPCEGVFNLFSGPDFTNCTFVDNQGIAPDSDAPIGYDGGPCDFDFVNRYRNCIFWNNAPGQPVFSWGDYSPVNWLSEAVATHCLSDVALPWDAENMVAYPAFIDPANGDFHLTALSPCVDTGMDTSAAENGGVVADLDGRDRPVDGDGLGAGATGDGSDYDIGAYEYGGAAAACAGCHSADTDHDSVISLSELLRVIQFFNSAGYHCYEDSEDGYGTDSGTHGCRPHSSDYNPRDWRIEVSELLRVIQFFNSAGYQYCPSEATEDGFCPVQSAR